MEIPSFLRLAAETRDQIYDYLLSTEYTKYYPKEEDPEWEYNPEFFGCGRYKRTPRPTYVYHFQVGILGANRQINREASKVLYDQNMFVSLISGLTRLHIDFKWLGVPVVAQGAAALRFVYCVLHIKLKPQQVVRFRRETPIQLIFAGADLPAFSKALLLGGILPDNILRSSLSFNLNCNTTAEITRPCASFSTPRLRNLLEPLRLLHGFQFVSITGPLDEKYKTELCLSICKKAPTFQESLFKLLHESKKGDEAFKAGGSAPDRLRRAIRIYNGVMTDLKDQCARFDRAVLQSRTRSATTPVVADVILHIGYTDLVFKLEHKLAMAHYRLSQYEEARKWSARAVKTIVEDWAPLVANRLVDPRYAYAYQLNARANRSLGRYKEAVEAMEGAVRMAPHLAKVLQLYRDEEGWHREMQRKTVKMVLDGGRDRKGRRFVMRYPADFEDVKRRLPEQCA